MRGSPSGRGDSPEYSLLNNASGDSWPSPWNLQGAVWRLDGAEVNPVETGLSGGWDLISMNIVNTTYPTTNADGFAFDGRGISENPGGYVDYMGCQRLAEVLIYNRRLTDEETRSVEAYLARKWRFKGTNADVANSVGVVLGDDTSLDLGGNRQYLASLSGAGSVRNGVLAVGSLVVDAADDDIRPVFAADAALSVEPGMRIVLKNASSLAVGDVVTVLDCELVNAENIGDAVIVAEGMPDSVRARLRYRNGVLAVHVVPAPTFIIVR